jgi:hypothetical protein
MPHLSVARYDIPSSDPLERENCDIFYKNPDIIIPNSHEGLRFGETASSAQKVRGPLIGPMQEYQQDP